MTPEWIHTFEMCIPIWDEFRSICIWYIHSTWDFSGQSTIWLIFWLWTQFDFNKRYLFYQYVLICMPTLSLECEGEYLTGMVENHTYVSGISVDWAKSICLAGSQTVVHFWVWVIFWNSNNIETIKDITLKNWKYSASLISYIYLRKVNNIKWKIQ